MSPPPSPSARVDRAVAFIRDRLPEAERGFVPEVGIVLGSGLGALANKLELVGVIPYAGIPGFLPSTVEGHAGRLCLGRLRGVRVAAMQGRVHLYEGHTAFDVVLPVRVLVRLGAKELVITNAAGGVNPSFQAGELMLISDQLNLTGHNPLVGPNDPALGPRFPDLSDAYSKEHRSRARQVASRLSRPVQEGVYAGLLGPSYETPAEVRMLGRLGADAVGMSTVLEVIAARHMGARVLGLSVISNQGAGISPHPLSHDEVKRAAEAAEEAFEALISGFVEDLFADKA
jgi:purine-nucleoside phosphorylase